MTDLEYLQEQVNTYAEAIRGLTDQHHRDSAELRRLCGERDKAKERIEALTAKCALLEASLAQAHQDTKRLDFMLAHDAFTVRCDRGGPNPQYQLMNQGEDENYHVLHNDRRFFNTEREAIDAALAATSPKEPT